VSDMVKIQSSV